MRFLLNVLVVVMIGYFISALAAAIDRVNERYLSHPEVLQREFHNRVSAVTHPAHVPAGRAVYGH